MNGAPVLIARSITLHTFCAMTSPMDPPNTVKSWEDTKTLRPSIVPYPVITPSPGGRLRSIPKSCDRCTTNGSVSTNEPGSISRSRRSRAVSLPRSCCFFAASRPPGVRAERFFFRSSAIRSSTEGPDSDSVTRIGRSSLVLAIREVYRGRIRVADGHRGASSVGHVDPSAGTPVHAVVAVQESLIHEVAADGCVVVVEGSHDDVDLGLLVAPARLELQGDPLEHDPPLRLPHGDLREAARSEERHEHGLLVLVGGAERETGVPRRPHLFRGPPQRLGVEAVAPAIVLEADHAGAREAVQVPADARHRQLQRLGQ